MGRVIVLLRVSEVRVVVSLTSLVEPSLSLLRRERLSNAVKSAEVPGLDAVEGECEAGECDRDRNSHLVARSVFLNEDVGREETGAVSDRLLETDTRSSLVVGCCGKRRALEVGQDSSKRSQKRMATLTDLERTR